MKELFEKQAKIYEKYKILICYFCYQDQGEYKFAIYFKDLVNHTYQKPITIIKNEKGETIKYYYTGNRFDSLEEALEWVFNEIENYIKK